MGLTHNLLIHNSNYFKTVKLHFNLLAFNILTCFIFICRPFFWRFSSCIEFCTWEVEPHVKTFAACYWCIALFVWISICVTLTNICQSWSGLLQETNWWHSTYYAALISQLCDVKNLQYLHVLSTCAMRKRGPLWRTKYYIIYPQSCSCSPQVSTISQWMHSFIYICNTINPHCPQIPRGIHQAQGEYKLLKVWTGFLLI